MISSIHIYAGVPNNAEANVFVSNIVVSGFEFQSRYYVHFQTNTLGKGMNTLIPTIHVVLL